MDHLATMIRDLVDEGRYVVSEHASERITECNFFEWQVIEGTISGIVLRERPRNRLHPAVEYEGLLPDGARFKSDWCLLRQTRIAKLVTVHYLDEE